MILITVNPTTTEPTRIVVGCTGMAHDVCTVLDKYEVKYETDEVMIAPERDEKEKARATAILDLVMLPAEGRVN